MSCPALLALALFPLAAQGRGAGERVGTAAAPTDGPFEPYVETIPGTKVRFEMVPVTGGSFCMGSPAGEPGRADDEGPQVQVQVGPFWMGRHEVSWNEYDPFAFAHRKEAPPPSEPAGADAVTRPTPPYADESFGYGKGRQPALSMTHHAAMEYCRWLSERTGHLYRLPTEAEWEYACRAGTASPWGFGGDARVLGDYAWSEENADDRPRQVAGKKPNAWGLFDLHGNVAEWVVDAYDPGTYAEWAKVGGALDSPVRLPDERRYPHVVRGGSWDEPAPRLRCAARRASEAFWNRRDPQRPQSIWWLTDATHVGFRVVRPVTESEKLKGLRSRVTRQSP